ncbi:MAG: ABC transporter permease [Clostridia bacterium]|nr:ABC transporter permease [Clostridia bacterium]
MAYKIIAGFLVLLVALAFHLHMDMIVLLNLSFIKFAMNGLLVLSLIPMLNAGMGMNFGLPVGITAGLIGMCIAVNFKLTGLVGLLISALLGGFIALAFSEVYGRILIAVKGREEIASTFIGFSFIPLMNFFWSLVPFSNRQMLYPIGGSGLRPRIGLNPYFTSTLDQLWSIKVGNFVLPFGLLLVYGIIAGLIHYFFKTTSGKSICAVGENDAFAKASGLNVKKIKLLSVRISLVIAAVGIVVYAQSFGFLELYDAPLMMAFPAVSALLIGGASAKKGTIIHAIIGTYLFQSIYLLSVPIANELLLPEISEIVRNIITNGIILYALLISEKGGRYA